MTKVTHVSLLLLSCIGIACCFTNSDFFHAIKDQATDMKISYDGASCDRLTDSSQTKNDQKLDDDIIDIPGAPTDEFDTEYFIKQMGFVPYEADVVKDDDGTMKFVNKYCHYEQYLANGLQDIDSEQDQVNGDVDNVVTDDDVTGDVQCHHYHYYRHNHHYHQHCHHHQNYLNCKCERSECKCCFGRTIRFNHCTHVTTFYIKACLYIKYRGKGPCGKTTTITPQKTTTYTPQKTTTYTPQKTTTYTPQKTTTGQKTITQGILTTTPEPTPRPKEELLHMNEESVGCHPPGSPSHYDIIFEVNGYSVYEYCVTTDYIRPLCYRFNAGRGVINACMDFYSVDKRTGKVCVKLTGTWTYCTRVTQLRMHVGCMKLPHYYNRADLLNILTKEMKLEELLEAQELDE